MLSGSLKCLSMFILVAMFGSADAPAEKLPEALHIKVKGFLDGEKIQSHREGFVNCSIPLPRGFCGYPAELSLINESGEDISGNTR